MTSKQKLNDYLKRLRSAIAETKSVAEKSGTMDALRTLNMTLHGITYDLQYEDEVYNN